jgi:hypothetical protein
MATVARRLSLNIRVRDVGETLLTSKLQILQASGNRRPSIALSILTGRVAEQLSVLENFYAADLVVLKQPELVPLGPVMARPDKPHFFARTVYLSQKHVHDIDAIIDAFTKTGLQVQPRRMTRSAVLRRAIERLRDAVEADPAKTLLENE